MVGGESAVGPVVAGPGSSIEFAHALSPGGKPLVSLKVNRYGIDFWGRQAAAAGGVSGPRGIVKTAYPAVCPEPLAARAIDANGPDVIARQGAGVGGVSGSLGGGLDLLWSRGWLATDIGRADFTAPGLPSLRVLLPRAGAMTQAEAGAFVDGLERASAENRYFGGYAFYAYVAARRRGVEE